MGMCRQLQQQTQLQSGANSSNVGCALVSERAARVAVSVASNEATSAAMVAALVSAAFRPHRRTTAVSASHHPSGSAPVQFKGLELLSNQVLVKIWTRGCTVHCTMDCGSL